MAAAVTSSAVSKPLFDVVVVGGGVVGSAFAGMLASSPRTRTLKVLVVEPQQFPPAAEMLSMQTPTSARHVALNAASVSVLRSVGVWDGVMSDRCAHFDNMKVRCRPRVSSAKRSLSSSLCLCPLSTPSDRRRLSPFHT